MFWISRPPYAAWLVAAAVAVLTLWIELRPSTLVDHPYLTESVAVGGSVQAAVEWRRIPSGVLEPTEASGYALRALESGEPLLASDTTSRPPAAPPGWWTVDVDLPAGAQVGDAIQLVVLPEPGQAVVTPIPGVVIAVGVSGGAFADESSSAAAFAPDRAAAAAVAIAERRVSVLVQAGSDP